MIKKKSEQEKQCCRRFGGETREQLMRDAHHQGESVEEVGVRADRIIERDPHVLRRWNEGCHLRGVDIDT